MLRLEVMELSEESQKYIQKIRKDPDIQRYGSLTTELGKDEPPSCLQWRYFSAAHKAPPLFISLAGERIGYIRFRPFSDLNTYEISVALEPAYRGKGYGKEAVVLAEQYAKQQGISFLVAVIKKENKRSIHLFEGLGYAYERVGPFFRFDERIDPFTEDVEELLLYKKALIKNSTDSLFLVAEIGSNWIVGSKKKNREMAQKLITVAKESGCDAVKFQVYRADETYAVGSGKSAYLQKSGIDEEIRALLREHEVESEEIPYIAEMAKKADIEFMATAFSLETFQLIDPFVQRHKIASYEISDPTLLDCVARSQKPLFLSTGATSLAHIAWALEYLKKRGFALNPTLLQCTAAYPADENDAQIAALQTLQSAFGCNVGLSDHTIDPVIAPLLAIGLGATVIEKHITISKLMPGPDHAFALEPHELRQMVQACRRAKKMIGDGQKQVRDAEKELFFFAQRGLQAIAKIKEGDVVQLGKNVAFLRPGTQKKGAHPLYLSAIEGQKANRSIEIGEGVNQSDIQ